LTVAQRVGQKAASTAVHWDGQSVAWSAVLRVAKLVGCWVVLMVAHWVARWAALRAVEKAVETAARLVERTVVSSVVCSVDWKAALRAGPLEVPKVEQSAER